MAGRKPRSISCDPDQALWQLYNVDSSFSQANDLAAKDPHKLRELQDRWWVEAARHNVLPSTRQLPFAFTRPREKMTVELKAK
jgi:arylsulfatase